MGRRRERWQIRARGSTRAAALRAVVASVLCRCLQWDTKLDEARGETGGVPEDT